MPACVWHENQNRRRLSESSKTDDEVATTALCVAGFRRQPRIVMASHASCMRLQCGYRIDAAFCSRTGWRSHPLTLLRQSRTAATGGCRCYAGCRRQIDAAQIALLKVRYGRFFDWDTQSTGDDIYWLSTVIAKFLLKTVSGTQHHHHHNARIFNCSLAYER